MGIIGIPHMGGSKMTFTIYGAKKEEVSYSFNQVQQQSFLLNDNGIGQITVSKKGYYSFTGNIGNYTFSENLRESTEIYLRPKKIIYWYGVTDAELIVTTGYPLEYNENNLYWNLKTGGSYGNGRGNLDTQLNGIGYTTCKLLTTTQCSEGYLTYSTCTTSTPSSSEAKVVVNTGNIRSLLTMNFTPDNSGKTIRINADPYGDRYVQIWAWYLE